MKYLAWSRRPNPAAIASIALAFCCLNISLPCNAQSTADSASELPQGVTDVVKLAKVGLSEEVIIAQIKSSGATYRLNTDQIIYLNNAGVSQNVIKALIGDAGTAPASAVSAVANPSAPIIDEGAPPAANAAPSNAEAEAAPQSEEPATAEPPAQVNYAYFQQQLSPYGNWVQTVNGPTWVPTVANSTPGWRPYSDDGRWVYTDDGLFWQSDYPWGDVAFHYGRWYVDPAYGWAWVPAYDWAPAWVAWRNAEAEGACGWAPLPPAAVFVPGVGLTWMGRPAVDVEFGLGVDAYVFIGAGHFWEHDYRHFYFERARYGYFYHRSFIRNGYRFEGERFHVEGMGRTRLAAFTHHEVRVERAGEIRAREERSHFEVRHAAIQHREIERRAAPHNAAPRGLAAHERQPAANHFGGNRGPQERANPGFARRPGTPAPRGGMPAARAPAGNFHPAAPRPAAPARQAPSKGKEEKKQQ